MVKLPVFDVLGQAFSAPFRFVWPLLPFFIAAISVALGLIFLWFQMMGPLDPTGAGEVSQTLPGGIGLFFIIIVAYLVFLSVAVLTHRIVAGVDHPWNLVWPVVRYFFVGIGLGLIGLLYFGLSFSIVAAISGATTADADVAGLGPVPLSILTLIALAGIAIGARLFLALPAAALGRKGAMRLAWRLSSGNTFRLFGAWMLYFILMIAINAAAFLVVGGTEVAMQNPEMAPGGMLGAIGAGWLIVNVVVNYYVTVAGAAFLTYSLIALLPNEASTATSVV